MFGVTNILNSSDVELDEYYKILNCKEDSTEEQINAEFKVLAFEYHPDKNPGDKVALQKFQAIQEARDTLLDPTKRKLYDTWLRSDISIPFKQWIYLGNRMQPTMHWVNPKMQTMIQTPKQYTFQDAKNEETVPVNASTSSNCTIIENIRKINKKSEWESESSCGIYSKFRNYEI